MTDEFASVPRLNPSQRSAMPESDASTSRVVRRTLPILVVLMSFVALALSADRVIRSGYFTIQRVEVTTRLDVVDKAKVERSVWRSVSGNYLNVDLGKIEAELETLPGVYQSVVRRVWPNSLAIEITETHARAEYRQAGSQGNVSGGRFINLAPEYVLGVMPMLEGPSAYREQLTETFRAVLPQLMRVGLSPRRLAVSHSGRWEMELATDATPAGSSFLLLLGREDIRQKVERFAASYPDALANRAAFLARVDMRYANGFAVRWVDVADQERYQLAALTALEN
jgi:cell division protein FtsQ